VVAGKVVGEGDDDADVMTSWRYLAEGKAHNISFRKLAAGVCARAFSPVCWRGAHIRSVARVVCMQTAFHACVCVCV
jgi:hypothetical protein